MENKDVIVEKTVQFSLKVSIFCQLLKEKKKWVIARQLLRSGTSIGANIHEAQNAESKADFIHQVKLAVKELEETKYWITLCKETESYPFDAASERAAEEIGLIIYNILSSSKKQPLLHSYIASLKHCFYVR